MVGKGLGRVTTVKIGMENTGGQYLGQRWYVRSVGIQKTGRQERRQARSANKK